MSPGELDTGKLTIVCAFCFHACVQLLMSVSMPVGHMITLHFVRLNHIFCFIYSICLVLYLFREDSIIFIFFVAKYAEQISQLRSTKLYIFCSC